MASADLTSDHLSIHQTSSSVRAPSSNRMTTPSYPELTRSPSTLSTGSLFSTTTNSTGRESFGSTTSYSDSSFFQSSTSSSSSSSSSSSTRFKTKQSISPTEKPFRRGYVRPQGTNFAASARSRESVLSLGSIAHLQYYFARTGLLDGRGGRRARKIPGKHNTEYLVGDDSCPSEKTPSNMNPIYTSAKCCTQSSLEHQKNSSSLPDEFEDEEEEEEEEDFSSEDDEEYRNILPPTVSTYNHREKQIPRLPTIEELKEELEKTLSDAVKVLAELKLDPTSVPESSARNQLILIREDGNTTEEGRGWHEIQGVHILDVMTLAIRAAKMYYTAHDQPERLVEIKPERQIRAELLTVMEVLRKMATRNFVSGVRGEEREALENWVASTSEILRREEAVIEAERSRCESWGWLNDNWSGIAAEREWAFMKSMDPDSNSLPAFKSVDDVQDDELPTDFLRDLMTGLRLVKLHNAVVRKSKRPFGAISRWHTDFRKPYRCTENLLFWIKAAELRFELVLDVDVASITHEADRKAWKDFENAILTWCSVARHEVSMRYKS